MNFSTFKDRLVTIKMLKDKLDDVSDKLTLAFSDDIQYNKIYADGFNKIEDQMVLDIASEISLYKHNEVTNDYLDRYTETLYYIIYETSWCTREDFHMTMPNGDSFDCTLWNLYMSDVADNLTKENCDTFLDPKSVFLKEYK